MSTGAALTASESAKHDPALIAIVKALARAAAARDYVASRENGTEQRGRSSTRGFRASYRIAA
jgi:hypothetical protein